MKRSCLLVCMSIVTAFSLKSQPRESQIEGKEVFKNDDVVFHQLDEHTWVGSGHVMSSETLYLVEGEDKALLIDAGTDITDLDKVVSSITDKPVTLAITHVHPDHIGSADYFPKLYMNPADTVMMKSMMPDYEGELIYLKEGQIIDLGGRQLEVLFTPPHTPGSTTYIDKEAGYGFSGDSFGSGNLLLFGTFSELISTCGKTKSYMDKNGIEFFYPGHFFGQNKETKQRVADLLTLSKDVLSGKVKGESSGNSRFGLDYIISDYGVRINYGDDSLK